MKKLLLLTLLSFSLSSCCTLFTPSKQTITFSGDNGVKIYDNATKIAEIREGNTATARVRKKLSDKTLIAKKEGYRNTPLILEATFNPVACINLLNVVSWAIDLGTQKACKWDNTVIEIEMQKADK